MHSSTVQGENQPEGLWKTFSINLLSMVAELYAKVLLDCVVESTEGREGEE